ncbi:MAG TPA: serine/threonine-protein kinase [Kofleriaceae bacterium]|nr:serine/threonine-protein kinase [Kofleriaceae bacterium]
MEQTAQQDDPLIGSKVGNYEVKQKLGEGGMGSVYLAVHPRIGKRVALKVLHSEFSSNDDVISRFFNEAKAVNDIQHPNIVDIIDYGTMAAPQGGGTVVYFIMEFLSGESLAKIIHDQAPLAPERAQAIALQVADALGASHRHGIVHRDLKPDNVMLSTRRDGRDFVKVLDFGIAKLTGDQPGSRRTRTGIVMGTPAYMSPEQCEGRGFTDHRTDVYALGILLYEMLTGQVPFRGEGYGEVLVQHMTQIPQRPSTIRGVIPPHLEAVCMKALEKRPDQRFASMDDFMQALADPVTYVDSHGGVDRFSTYSQILAAGATPTPYPMLAHGQSQYATPPPVHSTPGTGQIAPVTGYGNQGSGVYHAPGHAAPNTSPPAADERPARSGTPKLIMIAGGAVLAGVIAFFAWRAMQKDDKPAAAAPPVAAASPPVTAPVQTPDKPVEKTPDSTVVEPTKIDLEIAFGPAKTAELLLGGSSVANGASPLKIEVDKGTAPVELIVRSVGFQDRVQTITPDRSMMKEITLVPVDPASGKTPSKDRTKVRTKTKTRQTGGQEILRPTL